MKDVFERLPDKPFLRLDEVAVFFSVTQRTVYNWYASGRLTGCNPNGSIRIYRASVVDLVEKSEGQINVEDKPRRKVISPGIK